MSRLSNAPGDEDLTGDITIRLPLRPPIWFCVLAMVAFHALLPLDAAPFPPRRTFSSPRPLDAQAAPGAHLFSAPLVASTAIVQPGTLAGRFAYRDTAGHEHPIRYAATVRIATPQGDLVGATDADGQSPDLQRPDLPDPALVELHARDGLTHTALITIGPSQQSYYFSVLCALPTSTCNYVLPQPIRNAPDADRTTPEAFSSRVFSIFDALVSFSAQEYRFRGRIPDPLQVIFPSPDTFVSDRTMHLQDRDALDWDVIGHEFFHIARPLPTNPMSAGSTEAAACALRA